MSTTRVLNEPTRNADGTAELLAAIWSEVLQRDTPITGDDNFFSLGGDSLAMMMVVFRTNQTFSIELDSGVISQAPTLREFCSLVETFRQAGSELGASEGVI